MKNILSKTAFLLFGLFVAAGCKEAELMDYEIADEAINFYTTREREAGINQNSYPDILTVTYSPNTYANNNNKVEEITVDFSIQTMGNIRDFDRKAVMRAKEITGYQVDLPYKEVIVPAGENLVTLTTMPINHVPKGYMTKWVIEFDYDSGDFTRGIEERQERTVTIDNRFTTSSVNLTDAQWGYMAGVKATGRVGLGPFSSTKAMFMVDFWGTYNFSTMATYANYYLTYFAYGDIYGWISTYVTPVRNALAEYKSNWAIDPVNYPPLLDDAKNDGSWIAFEEE